MGTRNTDRLWLYGGIAGAVLLLALTWFLAISPRNAEADGLRQQTDDTQTQLITLRRRLSELKAEYEKLPTYRAALKTNQEALPTTSGVPAFLRQLQGSGDAVGVKVTGVSVSPPEPDGPVPNVFDLPITVTVEGSVADLGRFLDRLQLAQPRAVLVESVGVTEAADGKKTLTVLLRAFVAKGSPTAAASPSAAATD